MNSDDLLPERQAAYSGGVNSPVRAFRSVGGEPFFVKRAEGSRIFTVEGRGAHRLRRNVGAAILGHAPEVVVAAVCGAAANGLGFGIPNPFEVEMAQTICDLVPSIAKVRMVNSGTEATMSCIQLARGSQANGLLSSKAATMDMSIRCSSKQAVARLHTGSPIAPGSAASRILPSACRMWLGALEKAFAANRKNCCGHPRAHLGQCGTVFGARLSRGTPGSLRSRRLAVDLR